MGRIFSDTGVQADIWDDGSVDTLQAAVDATCEVEEAEEVPKGHDQQGFAATYAGKTWVAMRKWQSVYRKEVRMVMGLEWFREMGLVFLDDFTLALTSKTGML